MRWTQVNFSHKEAQKSRKGSRFGLNSKSKSYDRYSIVSASSRQPFRDFRASLWLKSQSQIVDQARFAKVSSDQNARFPPVKFAERT